MGTPLRNFSGLARKEKRRRRKNTGKTAGWACSLVSKANWRAICSQRRSNHGSQVTPAFGVSKFAPTSLGGVAPAQVAGGGGGGRSIQGASIVPPTSICCPRRWRCPRPPRAASLEDSSGSREPNQGAPPPAAPPAPTWASRGRPARGRSRNRLPKARFPGARRGEGAEAATIGRVRAKRAARSAKAPRGGEPGCAAA